MFEYEVLSAIFKSSTSVNYIRSNPACLPVPVSDTNMKLLKYGYCASMKANGRRALLFYFDENENDDNVIAYLFLRDSSIRMLTKEETTNNTSDVTSFVTTMRNKLNTSKLSVFDVEEMQDDNMLLVFDCLMIQNMITVNECISVRYKYLTNFIRNRYNKNTLPLLHCVRHWKSTCYFDINTTIVTYKNIYDTRQIIDVWKRFQTEGNIFMEGIIFNRLRQFYSPYRCDIDAVLKWKDQSEITVDFRMRFRKPGDVLVSSFEIDSKYSTDTTGEIILSSVTHDDSIVNIAYASSNGTPFIEDSIGEFGFQDGHWIFKTIREHKKKPNRLAVVIQTINSIEDPVTLDVLAKQLKN